jgi:hypothetical protein
MALYPSRGQGRCERLFGTGQGRLPQELRLRGITTVEARAFHKSAHPAWQAADGGCLNPRNPRLIAVRYLV